MSGPLKHTKEIEQALIGDSSAESSVVASWARSKNLHKLEPGRSGSMQRLSAREFLETCDRLGSLIDTAQLSLDRLFQAVGSDGCCVLLADKQGIPVDRRGAISDDKVFNEWGLWTGNVWSEGEEGTNGIGTSIIEERALTIHKGQHFHQKNTGLTCSAAPIFDHEGNLIATLDVSSCRRDLTIGFSRLISLAVIDAARQIEAAHFEYKFGDARVIMASEPHNTDGSQLNSQGASLVAVDRDDLVIGATRAARRLFDLQDKDFQNPLPLSSLYGQEVNDAKRYSQMGRRIISQALAKQGGNISAAAKALGVSRATLHRKIKLLNLDT
ncbi:MAG: GAF domain-containing protein [Devosiaceae bacterium]|nr:GAF domain-containing protein [Devosiaceae bacterium]